MTIDANNLQVNAGLDAYVTDIDGVNLVTTVSAGGVLQLLAGGDITDEAGLAAITAGDTLWIEANGGNGSINLDNDGMAMSGANGITLRAQNNIFLGQDGGAGSTYSTAGGDIGIFADTDANNTGRFSMQENSAINSNGGNIMFNVSQFDLEPGSTVNAGAGTVTITATTAKKIDLNNVGDNDSALVLDIENVELDRITANTLVIGDTAMGGDLEIVNAMDTSAGGFDYHLDLRNAGAITSTVAGDVITAGANNITLNGGTINFSNGGMSGNVINLTTNAANLGTMNVAGNITATDNFTASTTGFDSDMLLGGTIAADNAIMTTTGDESRISTGAITATNDIDIDTTGVNGDVTTGVLSGVNATLDATNDLSSIAISGANLTGDLNIATTGATFGAITINGATNANDITFSTTGANSNINMYGGNVTAGGNLDATAANSDIVLDLLANRTHQAQNISLTANSITISRAGTLVEATGTGVGQNLTFDDNGGTPDPAINPGDTINAGGGGLVLIDGDFASAGTVRAAGGDNGSVTINYDASDLDLTDVTIMAEGGGVIRIVNDASGPGNNGTLDEQAGTGAGGTGIISINTTNMFDVVGTGANLTGSNIIFNVDDQVNLSGVFNASLINATTMNGDFTLTDTLTDLELGNLSAGGNIDIIANLGSINQNGTIDAADASLAALGDTSTLTTNGDITLTGDLSMTTTGATDSGISQTGDITAANAIFNTAGTNSGITMQDAGGGYTIANTLDIETLQADSAISLTGNVSAATLSVETQQVNSAVSVTGNVTTTGNTWLRTNRDDSDITMSGDISANRFDMTTSGDNSTITAGGGTHTATSLAIINTTGTGSTITLNGDINVTNGTGDLDIGTMGANAEIFVNADISAGDQVDVSTLTDGSHINLNGNVTGNTVNLSATGNGANIHQGAANIVNATDLNFNLGTGFAGTGIQRFNTNTVNLTANANGGDAYINETDDIAIGASDMNGGILDVVANGSFTTTGDISGDVISLDTTAANGSLTLNGNVTGATSVTLEATGAGTVTQNAGRVGGGLVTVTAATDIGSAGNRFDTDAATLDISGNNVYIDELNGVTLGAGNSAVMAYDLTAGGDIDVTGAVTGNTVNLNTTGVNGTININGGSVNGATAVTLTTPGNGAVNLMAGGNLISINGTVSVIADNMDLSGGTIDAGNGDVTLAASTASRSIGLGGGAGLLSLTNAELNNLSAGNLTIGNNATTGDMSIDAIDLTAVDASLHLRTAGTITDADPTDDSIPNIILANNRDITFDGAGGLGTGQIGNPGLGDLDVQIGGTGMISVKTNNAAAYINLTDGGYVGTFDVGTAGFELSAENGSILDGNGAANNFTAGADSYLTASGTIGTDTDPLDVNIVGGDLFVSAGGAVNGVSVNIDGTVMPTNDLSVVGGPPGLVIFNGGTTFAPPPPSSSSSGGTTFDPGPSLQVVDAIASLDPSLLTQPVTVVISTDSTASDDGSGTASPVRTEDMLNATVAFGSGSFTYEDKDLGQLDYVANASTDKVYVIVPLGDQIIKIIPVGSNPNAIIVNRAMKTAYVANSGSNTVSVISTSNLEVMTDIPVGEHPEGLALSPDGENLYVANSAANSISVIDTRNNRVVRTIEGNLSQPSGIDISPDGRTIYVANSGSNTIAVIDAGTGRISGEITVGNNPQALAVNPNGKALYVLNTFDGTMTIIDTDTGSVSRTVAVGPTPYGISVSRDGEKVYVADMSETSITIFDSTNFSVQNTISGNNIPLRFNIESLSQKTTAKPLQVGTRLTP